MSMNTDTRSPDAALRDDTATPPPEPAKTTRPTFAEEALRMGGKGAEEVRRMGAVDAADDQVESLFADKYRTTASPVHRAVWEANTPLELWSMPPAPSTPEADTVMKNSLAVVRKHRDSKTLLGADGKITEP